MAKNFFEIGRLGRSQPTAIDYSEGLQPTLDDLEAKLDESKLKRDTLLSQMPTGVAIEKVPEVFRGKVTDFLTQNRQQYIEASKVIASGIRPDDERYISAMNTINSVRLRFDNLSNDLELYATTRKESLNQTNASLGVIKTLQTDHNNLASGEMTKTLAINEDGNITYINNAGDVGLFKDDFKLNYQAESSFATTKSEVRGELRVFKSQKGATYDSIREDALNAFDTFFNNTTVDGIRHAIFSDQDFMESVVAKLGVDTKDKEAVQRKISELVEMGDIENLKQQFKEFYTGEGGYFETYFNEQPGYEETVIPKDTDPLTSYRNRKTKIIDKLVNKETLTVADVRSIGFPPVAISRENEQRKIKYDKEVGILEIVLPASSSTNFQDQVIATFEVDENGNLIGNRTDIRNELYNAHFAGDLIPEGQVDFKGTTPTFETESTNVYDAFNTRSDVWRQNDISYGDVAEKEGTGNEAELFIKDDVNRKVNIKLIKPGADKLKLTNPKNMGNFIRFFRAVNNTYQSGNYSMPENFGTINVKDFGYDGEVNDKGQPQDMNTFVKFVIDIFRGSKLWDELSGSNDTQRIDNLIDYLENYEKTNNIINDYKVN